MAFILSQNNIVKLARISNKEISANEKSLYLYLATYNPCYPSYSQIQKELGMGRELLAKSIKKLNDIGLLKYTKGKFKGNSSEYELTPLEYWFENRTGTSSKIEPVLVRKSNYKLYNHKLNNINKSKSNNRAKVEQTNDSPKKDRLFYLNKLKERGFRDEDIDRTEKYVIENIPTVKNPMAWLATGDAMESVLADIAKAREEEYQKEKMKRRMEYASESNKNPFSGWMDQSKWGSGLFDDEIVYEEFWSESEYTAQACL